METSSTGADGASAAVQASSSFRFQAAAKYVYFAGLSGAVGLGLGLRLYFVLRADFPLNDGGLFYSMVEDVQRTGFLLPAFTSYNLDNIPFSYPPLAFYLTGIIQSLTGLSITDLLRFFPMFFNVITIVVAGCFAQKMLRSRVATVWAVFTFALLPRGYELTIMGGGLTRSLGFLCAMLSLYFAYLLFTEPKTKYLVLSSWFAGLTILSQLEMARFLAFSLVLLCLFFNRSLAGLRSMALIAIGAFAVSSPWWVTVLWYHGPEPFMAALAVRSDIGLSVAKLTQLEPFSQALAILSGVGAIVCLARGRLFLPLWVAAIYVLASPSGPATATAPLSLLAGVAVSEIVMPLLQKASSNLPHSENSPEEATSMMSYLAHLPYAGLIPIALVLLSWQLYAIELDKQPLLLSALTREDRQSMLWVSANTPEDSRFLVITGQTWERDPWSEWFPALAKRRSIATVQGYGFTNRFAATVNRYALAQVATYRDAGYIASRRTRAFPEFTHVYIVKKGWNMLLVYSLQKDARFVEIYNERGAAVFLWLGDARAHPGL